MWREHDADDNRWEWRGKIKNALTQEDRPFRQMEGLVDAINELTDKQDSSDARGNPS
jgi:hypothetical protein